MFENRDAYLTCNYDPGRALCNPNNDSGKHAGAPSLDRCRSNCPNIARTDTNARQLRLKAEQLRVQAAAPLTPVPVADRLNQRANRLDEVADTHDHTRITARDEDDE